MRKLFVAICVSFLALGLARGNETSVVNRTGPILVTALPQTVAVGFPFQLASGLLVIDIGPAGLISAFKTLALGSDFTVTGGGYNTAVQMQTGSIVVVGTGANAVAVNDQIMIVRSDPLNQIQPFSATGPLTIALLEQAIDKNALLTQQLKEVSSRSLQFEPGEMLSGLLGTPTARANTIQGYDAAGNLLLLPQTSAPVYNVVLTTVTSIANLRGVVVTGLATGQSALVTGYYAANDGGGGVYVWNSTSTAADNGGTIIQSTGVSIGRWFLMYSGNINARWFGVSPSVVDNGPLIQNALNACSSSGPISVFIPDGTYTIATAVSKMSADGVELYGSSARTTLLQWTGANNAIIITFTGSSSGFLRVHDLAFDCNNKASTAVKTVQFGHIVSFNRCLFENGLANANQAMLDNFVETHNGLVDGCWFFSGTAVGLGLNTAGSNGGPTGWRVVGNEFQQVVNWALLGKNVGTLEVANNIIDGLIANAQKGFSLDLSGNVIIRGNYIEGVLGNGIVLNPTGQPTDIPTSASIISNRLNVVGQGGVGNEQITLGYTTNVTLSSNTFEGHNVNAIAVSANAVGTTITPDNTATTDGVGTIVSIYSLITGSGFYRYPGRIVSSTIGFGAAVNLPNGSTQNITSIVLPAGTWDVTGVVDLSGTGCTTTAANPQSLGISTSSGAFGAQDTFVTFPLIFTTTAFGLNSPVPTVRLALANSTTVYLVAQALFSAGSMVGYGTIRATQIN